MPKSSEPINKHLWAVAKQHADDIYNTPSAYKSGYIVKKYKELGGTFAGSRKSTTGLARWFAEDWTNQRGEVGYKYKKDVYRPSKRITNHTPKTWDELSVKQVNKAEKLKVAGKRAKFTAAD